MNTQKTVNHSPVDLDAEGRRDLLRRLRVSLLVGA